MAIGNRAGTMEPWKNKTKLSDLLDLSLTSFEEGQFHTFKTSLSVLVPSLKDSARL